MRKPAWLLFAAVLLLGEAAPGTARDTDDPRLMPYYTGRVFPTPQEAVYRDEFYPLGRTGVLVVGGYNKRGSSGFLVGTYDILCSALWGTHPPDPLGFIALEARAAP